MGPAVPLATHEQTDLTPVAQVEDRQRHRLERVDVDLEQRILYLAPQTGFAVSKERVPVRFEEVTALDIEEAPLRTVLTTPTGWDYAILSMTYKDRQTAQVIAGDREDLTALLARLRRDIGLR